MSGIIPPSIVNYDWTVKINDPSYLNVSFPFRVEIQSIWFTTQRIYSATNGLYEGVLDVETTERTLALAAVKSKNSKTQWLPTDNPTDFTWGFSQFAYDQSPDESLKPTMWLGNPDDANGKLGAFATGGLVNNYELSQRSTAAAPVEKNTYYNGSWDLTQFNAQKYDADVAIMNTDEMLQLFVYNVAGDWTDYANDGKVTISIAYTGAWNEDEASATPKTWVNWWND